MFSALESVSLPCTLPELQSFCAELGYQNAITLRRDEGGKNNTLEESQVHSIWGFI